MVKRSRDEASAPQAPQQAMHQRPTKSPQPKRPSLAGAATGKARGSMEKGRPHQVANRVPGGDSLSPQLVAGDEPDQAHVGCDVGSAASVLPRWWQLWLGRGGGMVVDCEELLWGWFPFTDEDFTSDGEKVEWFSIWGE